MKYFSRPPMQSPYRKPHTENPITESNDESRHRSSRFRRAQTPYVFSGNE
jgi:hypothetical protein